MISKQIVLITGATSGIGRATAQQLASLGYNLIITGRREDRLKALKEELSARTEVHTLCFDIQSRLETFQAIDQLPETWKDITILVNNAGLARGADSFEQADLQDWEEMIDTNVKGLLYASKAVVPNMVDKKQGTIINVSSIAGKEVYPGGSVYCASKHAVSAITKGMRIDLLKYNIRVGMVSPGMVNTEFSNVRFHGNDTKAAEVYKGLNPLEAKDVADAIVYMITRPAHVCIDDVYIMPSMQASARDIIRK